MPSTLPQALWNETHGRPVASSVRLAKSLLDQGLGLIGRPELRTGEALWIVPGGSIHTCGVAYPIDVLFLDGELNVLRVTRRLPPWRIGWAPRATGSVVEMRAGAADGVEEGDRLGLR